ncbi:MAG: hypothetical protein WAU70_11200 [Flavobacteriales bacterium]
MLSRSFLSSAAFTVLLWPLLIEPGCQAPKEHKGHKQKPAKEAPPPVVQPNTTQVEALPAPPTTTAAGVAGALHPPLWGYNAANLFNNANGTEPALQSMLNNMGTRVLRFPGGTLANFYHPDGKGYGLRASDVELVKGSNMYKSMGKSVEKESAALASRSMDADPLEGMIKLAKATGIQVLYVANIFSGSDAEVIGALKRIRDGGAGIAGVELGNEHYLRAYKSKFPDVGSYLKRAEQAAKAIRAEFPKVPLGIVVAPPPELKGAQGDNAERLDEWNASAAGCGFADAIVLHTYAFPKGCKEEAQGAELFTCMNTASIDYATRKLPNALRELSGLSSGRKPVWITEWNMHDVFEHFGNTLLQGLFAADLMFAMSSSSGVSISTCHNLLADGDGFNAISIAGKGTGQFNGQVLYHVSSMLKDVLVPGARMQDLPLSAGYEGSSVRLVQVPSGASYLVVCARSGRALSLAGLQLPAGTATSGKGTVLGAQDLLEGVGDNPVRKGGNLAPQALDLSDVRKAELPPYGLLVLKLGT